MALDIAALRSSFELVIERDPNLAKRFYDILFERYPEARAMFGSGNSVAQRRMLAQALSAVVDHLEDSRWLTNTLGAMGRRHVGYGASTQGYDWVGECLIAALAEIAGEDWTAELEAAWAEAYAVIVSLMLAGAETPVKV